MTAVTSFYLKKGNDLENFRLISEGICETQEQTSIVSKLTENELSVKIICSSIGAIALCAFGMIALIYKKAPKAGLGSILLSLPLFLFTTQNIQSKNLLKKQSSQTTQEIFESCILKIYAYTAVKQKAVRESFKNKLFTSQDQLIREIQAFAERYQNLSVVIAAGNHSQKLRAESVQILPFIQKIASQKDPAIPSSLYPKWADLQRSCRIFLNTEKEVPFVEIEETSGSWKVKPEAVDLYA